MKSIKQLTLLTLAVSYWLVAARSGDVMTDLSIQTGKLRQDVLLNLKESKWFFFTATASMRQMARRLPESSRGATVKALGKVVRAYVESSTFKQEWLQDVRTYYPYDESYTNEGLAKQQQAQEADKASLKTQMASLDQAFAQMDPGMLQLAVRAQLSQEEQELASLSGNERANKANHIAVLKKMLNLPPAEFKKQYLASLKDQAQANLNQSNASATVDKDQLAQQRKQKAEFDAHADFRPLLKKRLQDFIALTETVDFEARLVPMGYKQEFANPLYQRKPAEWKFLYRLGKEPVTEARLFAQQWLADLP
ncbi:hypothetical protein GO730_37075 [Spirosoma sp. HMF3257]|uniref:DUF3106 domain-containing protein n=1 Tax=Spirosoma telluris TaxID=2183553 RepID=A0A327NU65_9BACT|nr:hypothetical protein [Spirosoma telluris]RAI78275.1 hypothetical protein HMF3257_37005 [Spirosoma telluris]